MSVVLKPDVVGDDEFHRVIKDQLADAQIEFEMTGREEHESFDAEVQIDGDDPWIPVTIYHPDDIGPRGEPHHCGQPDVPTGYPLDQITALRYVPITAAGVPDDAGR